MGLLCAGAYGREEGLFQSLGRDSVGWDQRELESVLIFYGCVSIPRSGFCGVGLISKHIQELKPAWFQSLGRDSVGWDFSIVDDGEVALEFQSLGRDSVGWDDLLPLLPQELREVSIPRSGFCGVGLPGKRCQPLRSDRFNPSVGILWGGTRC